MSVAIHACPDVAVSSSPANQKEAIRRQIPSQRNREVFAAVATGKSHSEAASEFGLTQPRVTQIVRQVREWSMQVAGGELGEFNRCSGCGWRRRPCGCSSTAGCEWR